jgi:hypothetical protein
MCQALVGLGALPLGQAATPGSTALELVWEAPAECPSSARVRAQVEALLSRDGDAVGRTLQARAQVARAGDGRWLLQLKLTSVGALDERELVGDSCQALADSVAVILALQLQPTDADAVEAAPPPRAEPAPPPPTPPVEADQEPGAASPSSFFQLSVAGTADSAALPRFALGGRADLGWSSRRVYAGLGFAQWLTQEHTLVESRAGRGHFGFRAGWVQACHGTWGEHVRFGPCLAVELGMLSARSSDVRVPSEVSELWLAALGGVGFWAPLDSHLAFTSALWAVAPLRRPRFVVEGIGEIHQPRAMGLRSNLGLAWRF